MNGLPDPQASRAVLVGVSRYATLESLPAVANNLAALAEALTSPVSWGLAGEHCAIVAEPSGIHEVLDPVAAAAGAARDTLLVYFAGHGLTDVRGDLFFGLPRSQPGLGHTGLPYQLLRDAIMAGRAQRHVIVLDCCFSGRALGLMGGAGAVADQAEIDGSYLLAAAPDTGRALAPPGETYTAFTGELLEVLTTGIDDGPRYLDMEAVYQHLRTVLNAKGRPLPQKRDRNTAGRLLLGRNPAYRPTTTGSPPRPADPRWPDPSTLRTPEAFLDALAEARVISGKTLQALSDQADPPISAGTISGLLNRETLPQTWKTTSVFLSACGLTAEQVGQWKTVWEQLKQAAPARPVAPTRTARAPEPARWWRPRRGASRRPTDGR